MSDGNPEWLAGYAAGLLKAARIADGHRALNYEAGNALGGAAASSVAAFIIEAAKDAGVWDESLPVPLIPDPAPNRGPR